MRIGITGASGFIGSHLVHYLVRQGHRPIALLELGSDERALSACAGQYDVVWGDITRPQTIAPLCAHSDYVFHLAGMNRYWSRDLTMFERINVVGTKNVADACRQHGVHKLVHVSSCITLGASNTPIERDESSPFNLAGFHFRYADTKKAAEDEIKRQIHDLGLPAVIVNPASAVGERDYGPTPIGKPISDICRGLWPVYVEGGACFIDVQDVARGLFLALRLGTVGEQYLLAGDNLSNREFMSLVARSAGVVEPRVQIPKRVLSVMATGMEWIADVATRRPPTVTRSMASLVGKYLYFDGSKARRELGFEPQPVQHAIDRAVTWFKSGRNTKEAA